MKCPVFKECGGCFYQHDNIAFHNSEKEKEYLKWMMQYPNQLQSIFMNDPFYYRHKVTSTFHFNRGKITAGLYKQKTHKVVDTSHCLIENQVAQKIVNTLRKLVSQFKIPIFDEDRYFGVLRHVMIRVGYHTKEVMVILVCAQKTFKSQRLLIKKLVEIHPEITTIILNLNARRTSIVLSNQSFKLYGPGFIFDKIGNLKFKLSPESFYQVNPRQTEILYQKAMELADIQRNEVVLDTYCGIGTLTLMSGQYSKESIGVEINSKAVKDANNNKRANRLSNVHFIEMDATEFMKQTDLHIDVLLMDPPREGSTPEFLRNVKRLSPERIVYVSCNPETLSRDLKELMDQYQVAKHLMVDQFPFTKHVEAVALLSKLYVKQHINLEIGEKDLKDIDIKKDATYEDIKNYVMEKHGLKVTNLYIAQVKSQHGIIERVNYNVSKKEDQVVQQYPPEKEKAIEEALEWFGMV